MSNKLASFHPALINDWMIKPSTLNGVICVVMTNIHSFQTLINYFENEADAQKFIEYWIESLNNRNL